MPLSHASLEYGMINSWIMKRHNLHSLICPLHTNAVRWHLSCSWWSISSPFHCFVLRSPQLSPAACWSVLPYTQITRSLNWNNRRCFSFALVAGDDTAVRFHLSAGHANSYSTCSGKTSLHLVLPMTLNDLDWICSLGFHFRARRELVRCAWTVKVPLKRVPWSNHADNCLGQDVENAVDYTPD